MGWKPGCSERQQLRKTLKSFFSPPYFFAVSRSSGLGAGDQLSVHDRWKAALEGQKHKVGKDSLACRADAGHGSQPHPGSMAIIHLPSDADGVGKLQGFMTVAFLERKGKGGWEGGRA